MSITLILVVTRSLKKKLSYLFLPSPSLQPPIQPWCVLNYRKLKIKETNSHCTITIYFIFVNVDGKSKGYWDTKVHKLKYSKELKYLREPKDNGYEKDGEQKIIGTKCLGNQIVTETKSSTGTRKSGRKLVRNEVSGKETCQD